MANLNVQRDVAKQTPTLARERWEPLRAFRDFFGWDPFAEMLPNITREPSDFVPAFDIKENKDNFIFKADVPGIKEADLDVRISQNRLSVSGKREAEKTEKDDTYYSYERSYGSFTRSFTLPEGTDGERIKADLKEGVLTIEVPKRPEAQSKKIAVKGI